MILQAGPTELEVAATLAQTSLGGIPVCGGDELSRHSARTSQRAGCPNVWSRFFELIGLTWDPKFGALRMIDPSQIHFDDLDKITFEH